MILKLEIEVLKLIHKVFLWQYDIIEFEFVCIVKRTFKRLILILNDTNLVTFTPAKFSSIVYEQRFPVNQKEALHFYTSQPFSIQFKRHI